MNDEPTLSDALHRAAAMVARADGLLITAGAGIGVDSGLPDFRGKAGFWNAYPALGRRQLDFASIACPGMFAAEPRLAWGFYGHRLNLYRATVPHEGFALLRALGERLRHRMFVFTSNVDGQFQKAGFPTERVCEVHGSIHHLQCLDGCDESIWPADALRPVIDEDRCLMTSELPICPRCGGLARPNILMFGDWGWIERRAAMQRASIDAWLGGVGNVVVVEVGAGVDIATVRRFGERYAGSLIRINPRDAAIPGNVGASIPLPGRIGVARLHEAVARGDLASKNRQD